MRVNINPKTQRPEWLEARRESCGSSDAPAILLPFGDDRPKFMDPFKVQRSKLDPTYEGDPESDFMDWGNRFERSVGEYVEEQTGMVLHPGGWYRHDTEYWMTATPDFWLAETERSWGPSEGVECKVVQNAQKAQDWHPTSAPPHVVIQAHWCMAVTGCDRWHIGCLIWFEQEFRHYTVERDLAFEAKMIDRARAWWFAHIVNRQPLPITGTEACSKAMADAYPTQKNRNVRDANDIETQILTQYAVARECERVAKTEKARCENLLKSVISGGRGLISPTAGKVLWSECQGRASLDQKALKAAHPEIFEEYTKRGPNYRRMTYSKPKPPKSKK